MLAEVSEQNDVQPCHDATHSNESPESWDCFEQCMGLYDDFGWATYTIIHDSDDSLFTSFAFLLDAPRYTIKIPVSSKIDPPPLTLVWYGCIGKDVEKVE